jgi:hypothetical protein
MTGVTSSANDWTLHAILVQRIESPEKDSVGLANSNFATLTEGKFMCTSDNVALLIIDRFFTPDTSSKKYEPILKSLCGFFNQSINLFINHCNPIAIVLYFNGIQMNIVKVHECVCLRSFWMWLTEWAMNPSPLGDLCIRKLRTILRRPLNLKVACLPLPAFVRSCVMLEHVLAEFD